MKLFYSPASPYARKTLIVAHEKGLVDRIELVVAAPTADDSVRPYNPLNRVPTLMRDDGTVLYDSPVIAEYFDAIGSGRRLFPAEGEARWTALCRQALGDGLCDAAFNRRMESVRPDGEKSVKVMQRHKVAVDAVLDEAERQAKSFPAEFTIGEIALAAGLGYLDLRFAEEPWRPGRAALAAWFDAFAQRPSMVATKAP